jgi:plasmid replication initiation protein
MIKKATGEKEKMEQKQISAEQKQKIVKSNEVIQKSRYKFTAQQQKLVLYMISKIRPHETEFKEYTFDLKNLCQILNIDISGGNYLRFRESIQKIADSSFWLEHDGKERLYRWFDDVEIEPNTSIVRIKFDKHLAPFLLQLSRDFTEYQLEKILCFDSKYSFRLYELFKSYAFIGKLKISVKELKEKLMIENKYDRFTLFKTNVLNKAIEEINKYTDLEITYNLIRQNRIITDIEFDIFQSARIDISNKINRIKKLKLGENKNV